MNIITIKTQKLIIPLQIAQANIITYNNGHVLNLNKD